MYIRIPRLLASSHLGVFSVQQQTHLHNLITNMMKLAPLALLLAIVTPSLCQRDWHIGADRVRPSGTNVHGHINTPSHNGFQGTAHGSHVFGGPHNGAQNFGGGLNYQHPNGLHGGVDATHIRGAGNTYSGHVGGSTRVGPGTLSVTGGAGTLPGSSKVQGQVGATYSVPLP